jgi:hypothetical protein
MFKPQTSNLKLLFLQAALPHPDREKLAGQLQAVTDWNETTQNLQQEGILPFFYQNLKNLDLAHLLPISIKEKIKDRLRREAMHQLHQDSVFTELAGLFNQNDIPFIPIKGLTLRHQVYSNPSLRPMLDLDLLIKPEDTEKITTLIKKLGARQGAGLHSEYLNSLQHHTPPMQYKNTLIEFHTRLFEKTKLYGISTQNAWSKIQSSIILNKEINMLPPEINLVYIAMHAYKHLIRTRFKLIWLTDVCLCLQNNTIDWYEVKDMLQSEADEKAFHGMMGLIAELGQFNFPDEIQAKLRPEWTRETKRALEKHLKGERSNQKAGVINALGRLDNQGKIKFITSVLFPSREFMKKKYKTNNPVLIGIFYPWHTFAKISEGLWYWAIRGKSNN